MTKDLLTNLSLSQLRQAVSLKERIEALQADLSRLLGGVPEVAAGPLKGRKRSPEVRARMAAAQRARWAKPAATGASAGPAATPKRKRKFSAAALARISASAKARWAKVKASGKKRLG